MDQSETKSFFSKLAVSENRVNLVGPTTSSTPKKDDKKCSTLANARKRKTPSDRPEHHSYAASLADFLGHFDGNNLTPQDMLSVSVDDGLLLSGQVDATPTF